MVKVTKKERKEIIWIAGIIGVCIFLIIFSAIFIKVEQKKHAISDESFFSDNGCQCTERNRNKCSEGYELQGSFCVNTTLNTYTNVLKGCTRYVCLNASYSYNKKTNDWR